MSSSTTPPFSLKATVQIMRLHQPVGNWLLFWPGAWALVLANGGAVDVWLLGLFAAGAVIMRSAGCIVNDLWDRKIDGHVARTAQRPLAAGTMSVSQALGLLVVLLCAALWIACQLRIEAFIVAALSLPLVAAYPAMKRITWWPQLFLGFTFNWGTLLGWVAATGEFSLTPLLLYAGGVFWTLGYDTIYALQDVEDDGLIGVKSTARLFGAWARLAVSVCYAACVLLWAAAFYVSGAGQLAYLALLAVIYSFYQQIQMADAAKPEACAAAFRANVLVGWIVFLGLFS